MKNLPLHRYSGRFVRLTLATTFEALDGHPILVPPGEVIEVLWVCNRSRRLLDVRVHGRVCVTSVANLNVCGQMLPSSHPELCEFRFTQPVAA